MNWIIGLIETPSAFRADPLGYARNQVGHGYAIGFLGALLLPWWAAILAYIVLETWQNLRRGADLSDNIEDFANVAVMVMAATAATGLAMAGFMAAHALYLASGVAYRVEERYRSASSAAHRQAS